MVHMATGYAKMRNRRRALVCTTSIGPGATNMVTGAATATVNRIPVLLLPGDIFATRRAGTVLQQIESPWSQDISANDAFKPVSRYWDRVNRPEQLATALMEAMRVLTSPADTGAVTLALPQDVQAEAFDFPAELFERRVWSSDGVSSISSSQGNLTSFASSTAALNNLTASSLVSVKVLCLTSPGTSNSSQVKAWVGNN